MRNMEPGSLRHGSTPDPHLAETHTNRAEVRLAPYGRGARHAFPRFAPRPRETCVADRTVAKPARHLGRLRRRALGLPAREESGDVLQDLVRADLVVPEFAHQAVADDADLLLRVGVDDRGDAARQLDRVAPVLEDLELERAAQARVLAEVEGRSLVLHGGDVVQELVPAVAVAR